MPRYAIIDYDSGVLWGVQDADTPLEACRLLDEDVGGGEEREYTELPRYDAVSSGYCVYRAPDDYACEEWDGPAAEAVLAMPYVALIKTRDRQPDDL